ncbi:MAG: 2-C-methyl-D-erythritol 2,4-cyclodiphosphate synthase [Chloroflexota bacterium]
MIRVGFGYDIHRLQPGDRVTLGGVEIPHTHSLVGHSDADVVTHALMDALLGAAALGDIGVHFPPSDEQYRDISSLRLLEMVRSQIARAGYRLVNADIVVVAEEPAIQPHAEAMRVNLARGLGVKHALIGLKATSNEGVGPEGRGEAISARAVATLESS